MTETKLKELIDEYIKANGKQEITGPVLNAILKEMADSMVPKHPEPLPIVVKRAIPINHWRPGQAYRLRAIKGEGRLTGNVFQVNQHDIAPGIEKWLDGVLVPINDTSYYDFLQWEGKYFANVRYMGNLKFYCINGRLPSNGSFQHFTLHLSRYEEKEQVATWDGETVTQKIMQQYRSASPYLEVRDGRVICVKNVFKYSPTNVILRQRYHSRWIDDRKKDRYYYRGWSIWRNYTKPRATLWAGTRIRVVPTCRGIRSIYFKEVGRGLRDYIKQK